MLVSGLALVVVVAAIAGIVATRPNPGPSIQVTNPSSTTVPSPTSSIGDRFVPPTTIENGLVVLPVTLPDGEQYTLRYPAAMRIAQLGFAGGLGVSGNQVSISYTTIRVYAVTRAFASTAVRTEARCRFHGGRTPVTARRHQMFWRFNSVPGSRRSRSNGRPTPSARRGRAVSREPSTTTGISYYMPRRRCRSVTRSTVASAACRAPSSSWRRICIAVSPSRTRACTAAS